MIWYPTCIRDCSNRWASPSDLGTGSLWSCLRCRRTFLTMDELHKLGLLYLQNGNWNGKQLVPESWVKEATSKQVENDKDSFGYGYLFWGGRENTFRATENIASVHHQSGEKRGYHCYRRMPQRPGTDGCGVYRGISAGINGYIWKMKGSKETESVFCFLLNI